MINGYRPELLGLRTHVGAAIRMFGTACALVLIYPATSQAQDNRDVARAFFRDTLSLNWNARDVDTAIAGITKTGVVLDVIIPQEDGVMHLLSDPEPHPTDIEFSRLYSVVTCQGSETQVEYMRFFHSGARDPLIDAILKATRTSGLTTNDPERAIRYPDFDLQEFEIAPDTSQENFSILSVIGPVQDYVELINYEAVLGFPCAAPDSP